VRTVDLDHSMLAPPDQHLVTNLTSSGARAKGSTTSGTGVVMWGAALRRTYTFFMNPPELLPIRRPVHGIGAPGPAPTGSPARHPRRDIGGEPAQLGDALVARPLYEGRVHRCVAARDDVPEAGSPR